MTIRLQQQQEMGIYCETAEEKELNETEMEWKTEEGFET